MSKDTGYEKLARAIIVQAAKDYRRALRKLAVEPENEKALAMKSEVEEFFCSDWFQVLTHADGKKIMDELYREVAA